MSRKAILFFCLLIILSFKSIATRFYVDSANAGGFQNGNSWATAYTNPQTAINAAMSGDSVWVAKGTYQLAAATSLTMKEGVKILGGFLNVYTSIGQRNYQSNITILKGSGPSVISNNNNNLTRAAVLDGFTITNPIINYSINGGGLKNISVSPTIQNCIFSGLQLPTLIGLSPGAGGAIYCSGGAGAIKKCTFVNNSVSVSGNNAAGGAVYFTGSNYIIDSCTFSNNNVNGSNTGSPGGGFGGAVYCQNGANTFLGCIFSGNKSTGSRSASSGSVSSCGGALYSDDSNCTILNCQFSNNTAFCTGTFVGFMYCYGGALYFNGGLIENCTFTGNNATSPTNISGLTTIRYGGGLYCKKGDIKSCTFTNNVVDNVPDYNEGYGGGFYLYSSINNAINVSQCILNNNKARYGGGGYINGLANIINCSFTGNIGNSTSGTSRGGGLYNAGIGKINNCSFDNNSSVLGGGLFNSYASVLPLSINNCVFRNNSAKIGAAIFNINSSASFINSLFTKNIADSIGGAIFNTNSSPKIINCTIAKNKANSSNGSGVYNASNSAPFVSNTILWGNSNGIYNDASSSLTAKYSLIQGFPAVPSSFLLAGTTNPLFVDTSGTGNYKLQITSPCINVGRNDSIPTNITTDIAGNTRIYGGTIDMGCYEYFVPPPIVNLGNDTSICAGKVLTLDAHNVGSSYLWNTGATTQTISVNTSGIYYVTVTDTVGSTRDSIVVTINPLPLVNLGNDTSFCDGNILILNAQNPGSAQLWQNSTYGQTFNVTATGKYYVTVTDGNLCKGSDTIQVTVNPLPSVFLGSDTTICVGSTLTLNAHNTGSSYIWKGGSTGQTLNVTTAGAYYVTVTNSNQCKKADTIQVNISPLPVVNLGKDTSFCAGKTFILNARNSGSSYSWNTGSNAQTIAVSNSGLYSVTVTNTYSCKDHDTIQITVNPSPMVNLGNDTTITTGTSLILNAANPGSTYLWNTGATSQNILVTTSGTYFVAVTNGNDCTSTDTIRVTVNSVGVNFVRIADYSVSVSPNPAKEILSINCTNQALLYSEAFLINAFGQVVKTINIESSSQKLSLLGLASGVYILKIKNGQTLRIIKE